MKGLPLFESKSEDGKPTPPKPWTVSELTTRIKGVIEPAFPMLWVQGEVSNCRPSPSGYVYFSLKDEGSTIPAVLFKKPQIPFKDGAQVLCRGKVSVYQPQGRYQFVIDQVQPMGAGALQAAFEQLKAKLAAEGLFDPKRKRPLPSFPRRIAIITSPSSAAIRDMLNILGRRAPHVRVTIIPALVQGTDAPAQLIKGIEQANQHALGDVIVLGRGGGSIEDLWCFNDEGLARAIAASKLPVVSGVGHEIDFTIADFVADLRAPTPSAAAEIVTARWVEAHQRLRECYERIVNSARKDVQGRKAALQHLAARLVNPKDKLREQAQRCDEWLMRLARAMTVYNERQTRRLEECRVRLPQAMKGYQDRRRHALEQAAGRLDALSPLRVLQRGYSIVQNEKGDRVIRSKSEVSTGEKLKIRFSDGEQNVQAVP